MRAKLGLSDEQAAAVKPIIEERFERGQTVMDRARPGGSWKRGELQALMDDLKWKIDKKLAAVLAEDQMLACSRWVEEEAVQKSDGDRPEPPGGGSSGSPGPLRRKQSTMPELTHFSAGGVVSSRHFCQSMNHSYVSQAVPLPGGEVLPSARHVNPLVIQEVSE
ncbi:hypothetical protein [Pseudodesulfovibrio methanolicus]|uniref:Uncharacterized protein n=1 Tax=Pseudodesulfovibrio methanolicus TaxID=3126690 RepID=A0ABZ2IY68_9BACT